ncbi:MAG: Asp-tRNA(Asn)/Glu-tRNA(Gln) amidotransferase subunit GatC [Spirochaetes bacterium]|nr:Asp-tRNA(Asn)/Glu-tRNA(Gln) amidotransferase subunit GatC [Spirochaetota bacterium]
MQNVKRYEMLNKLELAEDEYVRVSACADKLTESFKLLEGIDTSGAEPLITVLDIQNVLREDVCVKTIPREELLAPAPDSTGGFFRVPKTLE